MIILEAYHNLLLPTDTRPVHKFMTIDQFHPHPLTNFELKSTQIDLWFLSISDNLTQFHHFLTPEEQNRGNRFQFERHQRRFKNARSLLRMILSQYLQLKPGDIQFETEKHGKPFIDHPVNLQFNLSHSGDWLIIAVGQQHPLGVDIEQFSIRPYQGIAGQMFSDTEQEFLRSADQMMQATAFFKIWAQKEAFIKANGAGLSYPTQQFTVPLKEEKTSIVDSKLNLPWQLVSFMPITAIFAALCHHPEINSIRYQNISNPLTMLSPRP